MLFITTDKIKYGTIGASFTVTFSVAQMKGADNE